MLDNREVSTGDGPAQLDHKAVSKIVDAACRAHGLTYVRTGLKHQIHKLGSLALKSGSKYAKVTAGLALAVALAPFIFAQLITSAPTEAKWLIIAVIVVTWIPLVLVNYLLPKDLTEQSIRAEVVRCRLVIHRLAGQLALYNFIQKISSDEDEQTIQQFSLILDPAVQTALNARESEVIKILKSSNHPSWRDSCLMIGDLGISDELDDQLAGIAESVAIACMDIFSSGHFTVKIYITTTHKLVTPGTTLDVKLLTAVGRYPRKRKGHGKSWVLCRGARADVWNAQQDGKVMVYQRVKSASDNREYPSIACLPLPEGLGVISIESVDPSTYVASPADEEGEVKPQQSETRVPVPDHIITEDIHASIAVSVKELVVKAIRADMASREQSQ